VTGRPSMSRSVEVWVLRLKCSKTSILRLRCLGGASCSLRGPPSMTCPTAATSPVTTALLGQSFGVACYLPALALVCAAPIPPHLVRRSYVAALWEQTFTRTLRRVALRNSSRHAADPDGYRLAFHIDRRYCPPTSNNACVIWPSEQTRTALTSTSKTFLLSITACCRRLSIGPEASLLRS